ncbi:MAG: hypothetical protein ACYCR7_01945 [Thermoplasmataceae archaeon]
MINATPLDERFSEKNIKNIISSFTKECELIRDNTKEFLKLSIDPDIVKFDPLDQSLPLILWSLAYIDINSFTSRVINTYRDILESRLSKETIESVEKYAFEYGIKCLYNPDYQMYIMSPEVFATYSRRVSGSKFRLVNQTFIDGKIIVESEVLWKIIREAFVVKARAILAKIDPEACHLILGPMAEELVDLQDRAREMKYSGDLGSVDSSCFPPCVLHFLSDARAGVNLPHMARFTMVSFLHHVGMKNEEIMNIFKSAPDFNERITSYQVNHVTGHSSGTEYSPPKCSVLKSNHLCYMDNDYVCNSEWLKHPMQYYSYRKRRKDSGKPSFNDLQK